MHVHAEGSRNMPGRRNITQHRPSQANIPVVTDRGRGYRPYPNPHDCSQWNLQKRRPHFHANVDRVRYHDPLFPPYTPPSWAVPDLMVNYPPPIFGDPFIFLPNTPAQENFYSAQKNGNSHWGPWQGPPLYSGRCYETKGLQAQEHPRSIEQHERPLSHWEQQDHFNQFTNSPLVLILLRGVPGSGKSTLGRELLSTGSNGVILSTDDYFVEKNGYPEQAMLDGCSPVIIDNTNVKAWEMKPYVQMALENRYRVDFLEPETQWKYDPIQLERRTKHRVHRKTIAKMLDGFERPMNVEVVMNSTTPPHKNKANQQ
ncbi:hypothetical protein DNTS_005975 [Danionella cerebrum]|uniref:NEDD4-binding protein 2-like 2 n=1 Tax=Danionella cerebrum TaxID=2873325 RepID=A0A553QCD4_9TELE|nr:hypothetical protein DNTS_005975 [Danionella translucida]